MVSRRQILAGIAGCLAARHAPAIIGARSLAFTKGAGPIPPPPLPEFEGLIVRAEEDGVVISVNHGASAPVVTLEYSLDAITWNTFVLGTTSVALNKWECACFRAGVGGNATWGVANTTGDGSAATENAFAFGRKKVSLHGNVMSLVFHDGVTGSFSGNIARAFFCRDTSSIDASNVELPMYNNDSMYAGLFNSASASYIGCVNPPSSISVPNSVPNRYLSYLCKRSKIRNTPNIASPSQLGNYSFSNMFAQCYDLETTDVDLSAVKTVTTQSMHNMFSGCSRLTGNIVIGDASSVIETTSSTSAFGNMFIDCSSITSITGHFNTFFSGMTEATNPMYRWLYGLQSLKKTFYGSQSLLNTISYRSVHTVPSAWDYVVI